MTTALVIDDSREQADALCEILAMLDVEAFPAYGPRAAMLALRKIDPDIVYLDISMPGVNGFEVLAYLRRYPKLHGVPVVIVTSDDQPETADRVSETGALLLLIKPATVESIEVSLRRAGLIG
jgi:two-component system CheB/CheR fusion protein